MPPFKLEALRNTDFPKRRQQILYTQKIFGKGVKVTDWETHLESYPLDNDPYCPGKVNHFLSHYNRLGIAPDEPLQTITSQMLNELYQKKTSPTQINQQLVNFYSYSNEHGSKDDLLQCPSNIPPDYITTMQRSYTMPFPYKMQRFSLPTTPFMKYRRLKAEIPENISDKFLDDHFVQNTACRSCLKKSNWISYDPCTAMNNDGSLPKVKERNCYKLEY